MKANLKEFHRESLEIFKAFLKFDTTNPPGNEKEAIFFLKEIFIKEGFKPIVIESGENRANLVVKYEGTEKDKEALLLTSHVDVVEADPKNWKYPPFGGIEKEGFIWGRGSTDMKHMTIMELMTLIIMKRKGILPKRDIIFAAVADEETGGDLGAGFLVKNYPELIKAKYALNETGGFSQYIGKKIFYPVQVAEKGYCWLKLKLKGEGGHGSIPHKNNPVVNLAELVSKLGNTSLPYHSTFTMEKFIKEVASYQPFPNSFVMKKLLNPKYCDFILNNIFPDKKVANSLSALFHNTANPTIFHAGSKINVIPDEAEVQIDGRILPGQNIDSFLKELKKVIGNKGEITVLKSAPPVESKFDTPLFEAIKKTIASHDPEGIVVPYISSGFTDAKHYDKLGIICYGFTPLKLDNKTSITTLGTHSDNERIPIDAFLFGVDVMYDLVTDFCC